MVYKLKKKMDTYVINIQYGLLSHLRLYLLLRAIQIKWN